MIRFAWLQGEELTEGEKYTRRWRDCEKKAVGVNQARDNIALTAEVKQKQRRGKCVSMSGEWEEKSAELEDWLEVVEEEALVMGGVAAILALERRNVLVENDTSEKKANPCHRFLETLRRWRHQVGRKVEWGMGEKWGHRLEICLPSEF